MSQRLVKISNAAAKVVVAMKFACCSESEKSRIAWRKESKSKRADGQKNILRSSEVINAFRCSSSECRPQYVIRNNVEVGPQGMRLQIEKCCFNSFAKLQRDMSTLARRASNELQHS